MVVAIEAIVAIDMEAGVAAIMAEEDMAVGDGEEAVWLAVAATGDEFFSSHCHFCTKCAELNKHLQASKAVVVTIGTCQNGEAAR